MLGLGEVDAVLFEIGRAIDQVKIETIPESVAVRAGQSGVSYEMVARCEGLRDSRYVSFAGILKQLRVGAGLTQEELAEASGVAVRSISDLERGVNLTARRETARLLASALRLDDQARAEFEAQARGRPGQAVQVPSVIPAGLSSASVRALPRDIASFVGREDELRLITDAIAAMDPAASGVIGIWAIGGMAGIGKTAFAIHAAHQLAHRYPDGQIFLPLHAHTPGQSPVEPAEALSSLLQTVGVAAARIPDGTDARAQMWRDYLVGKRMLVVLDDVSGHGQVRSLLPGTAGSLVLVTSRRHLTALEETRTINLGTLTAQEAGALLIRLSERTGLGEQESAIAEITRLAGYLPLAVGMLARQLHHHPAWSVAGLVDDLTAARDRLALMRAENISVSAAFDLSYRDLNTDQQRVYRRLGLHPGRDVDAYAVAALDAADCEQARQLLDSLYDHYLLMETSAGRYQLHDLLRERARTLAGDDSRSERDAAVNRLLAYYLYTAREADRYLARRASAEANAGDFSPPSEAPTLASRAEAVAWMEAERHNLQATAVFASEHDVPGYPAAIAATMHGFLRNQGHWTQARVMHNAALDAARAAGDTLAEAGALTDLGTFQLDTGDAAAAIASHQRALGLHRRLGNQLGEANALNHLADAQRITRDFANAEINYTSGLLLHRDLGNPLGEAYALRGLGVVAQASGEFETAASRYEEALRLFRDLGNPAGEARSFNHLAKLMRARGDDAAARGYFEQSLAIADRAGSLPEKARASEGVAEYLIKNGDVDSALSHLRDALDIYRKLGMANADRVESAIDKYSQHL